MHSSFSRIAKFSLLVFSVAILGHAGQLQAQTQDRIVQAVDDSVVTKLKGNVHPLARTQNDLGAAPSSQPMNHLQLVLERSPAQEAALDSYLASLQAKNSPNYHKWLTPQQFGALFGPSEIDIQKLTTWLAGKGFTVNGVANGRITIDFSGTVAQVQNAFNVSIHSYQANGVQFLANTGDPSIPSAFAPVVSGVAHLNTVPLKPMHVHGTTVKFDGQLHRFVPTPSTSSAHAEYTANLGGYDYLVTVPADAATIYDTPNQTLNANFTGTTSYTGTGATIGIAGQSAINTTLVAAYRTLFVGDAKVPTITNIDGVGDVTGDDDESYLDNEIAGGLAPGANLHFYTESTKDSGVLGAAQYAIDTDNTVDILSVSYGSCELANTTSGNQQVQALWQQAAAQGITVIVSAGDTGTAACDPATDSAGNNTTSATGPLSVNGLASTAYDVAIGGTDFDVLATNFNGYVSSSSAGAASSFYRTALKYIPEDTWNDSTYNNTTVSQNVVVSAETGNVSQDNISAGGGGASNCATNTTTNTALGTCTAGYPKPTWQTGAGVPNDGARDVPDVSFLSGDGTYGALWAVCDNSTTGFDSAGNAGTANCVANTSGDFFTDGFGGTSTAAPAFAGIMAMVVEKTGQRQGQAAPVLYSLFASTPSIFHDVTTGNNSVPCTPTAATTATCLDNSQGFDYESGFDTNTGFDLATGLGSVDATLLVNSWVSPSGAFSVANVASTPSATTIASTSPLTFTVSVTALASGGAVPTGNVAVTDGTYTSPATPLVSGAATITIPASSLAVNAADTLTTVYAPATGSPYAPASSSVVIAITGVAPPTGSFTLSSTAATVSSPGQSGSSTVSIAPVNGYKGTVNLTCTLATAPAGAEAAYNPACSLSAPSVAITTAAGSVVATFSTTAPTSGALAYPKTNNRWYTAVGGAALACVLFFGIPARRRGWRSMLGLLIFLGAMTGLGCGGGGGGGPSGTTGTTTGAYTFTVVGTDSVSSAITTTATVSLTVN